MVVKNYGPYNLEQKGLSPISTEKGDIIWVNLDLLNDEQWTTSTGSKKAKGKARTSNTVSMLSEKDQSGITLLTDLEVETTTIVTHLNEAGQSGTWSGKNYLNDIRMLGQVNLQKYLKHHPLSRKNSASRRI